jgi:hypothetical protein
VAVVFFVVMRYSFSLRMWCMWPNFPHALSLSTAAAIWHNFTMNSFTVKMFGALLIQGRSYPSRVALAANAICVLALALAIVVLLIYTLFILLVRI